MRVKLFRLLSLVILAWMLFTKTYLLILYWVVFVGLVEFLNSQQTYKSKNYKRLNVLFFLYLLFITIIRTIPYKIDATIRYVINTIEHLLFSLVICLIIFLLVEIAGLFKRRNVLFRIVFTVVSFYLIGVLNEVYQNIATGKPALVFDKGSQIDLVVNFFGAFCFIFIGLRLSKVPETDAQRNIDERIATQRPTN